MLIIKFFYLNTTLNDFYCNILTAYCGITALTEAKSKYFIHH